MADQNITELPIKTNSGVASTDYMLGIDSAEGYQILVRDVAKYIVENYNGSSIIGSAQTVKSAFDALNSKKYELGTTLGNFLNNNDDLNQFYTPGTFACKSNVAASSLSNCPTTLAFKLIVEFSTGNGNPCQTIIEYSTGTRYYRHTTKGDGTGWSTWTKQPTRAEITELNSNRLSINVSSAEPISVPFGRYNVALVSGLAQGIGSVCLLVKSFSTGLSNVIDLVNGGVFSNAALTFEYIDSTKKLKITSTNSSASELDLVYLHKTV